MKQLEAVIHETPSLYLERKQTAESTMKPSYLEIAKRQTMNKGSVEKFQLPRAATHFQRLVNPEHTIIIEHSDDPTKYANTLELKRALDCADNSITADISCAKVISSGKILLEATDVSARDIIFPKMQGILHSVFGERVTMRFMTAINSSSESILIRGIPAEYSIDSIKSEILLEYPNIEQVISLMKPGSVKRFQSVKITMAEKNELSRILSYGVHIGLSVFRAEPWINPPTQCYMCQRFNHVAVTCKSQNRCINCGDSHTPDKNCMNPVKCANCGEGHKANFKGCIIRRSLILDRQSSHSTQNAGC